MTQTMSSDELEFIREAAGYMEKPLFLIQLADLVGRPLEKGVELLPESTKDRVRKAVNASIHRALDLSVSTINETSTPPLTLQDALDPIDKLILSHDAVTGGLGGAGGLFGGPAILIELPLTTTVMLRSIAAVAAAFGEDPRASETKLQCVAVFALGSKSKSDDAAESAFFALRTSLNQLITEAARFAAQVSAKEFSRALSQGSVPVLARLMTAVGARFESAAVQKFVAQGVPLIGAVTGSTINVLFSRHFNRCAKYHFGLRWLERRYGEATVKAVYDESIANQKTNQKTTQSPRTAP